MKALQRKETWILIGILVLAAVLRLYRLRDYLVFLGDEGRDVLVVSNILKGDLTLLGPTASVGGFYLGPIYYYMMAPFLWLWRFDPVGPAYLVAVIGVATVYLVYHFGKRFFHPVVGLVAAFLYATAPLTIRYSRASWNPNPLPFFALLGMLLLAHGVSRKKIVPIFLAGASLGVAWQLHYLAFILTAVYGVIILHVFKRKTWLAVRFTARKWQRVLGRTLWFIMGWIATFSPFLVFEIRHRFPNTRTVFEFITRRNGAIDYKILDIVSTFYGRVIRLFVETFSLPRSFLTLGLAAVSFGGLLYASRRRNKSLLIWAVVGLLGISMYQGDIHDYYFGFLFPVPYLMAGIVVYLLWLKRWWGKTAALILLVWLVFNFYQKAFFQKEPNRLINQTKTIAGMVLEEASGKPYNFALISTGNSDHAYRYFLEHSANPPLSLEEQVTEQIIIVCEQPQETCEPLSNPTWEVAGFGRKEIVAVERSPVGDISIFKLIHHEDSKNLIGKPAVKGG